MRALGVQWWFTLLMWISFNHHWVVLKLMIRSWWKHTVSLGLRLRWLLLLPACVITAAGFKSFSLVCFRIKVLDIQWSLRTDLHRINDISLQITLTHLSWLHIRLISLLVELLSKVTHVITWLWSILFLFQCFFHVCIWT